MNIDMIIFSFTIKMFYVEGTTFRVASSSPTKFKYGHGKGKVH